MELAGHRSRDDQIEPLAYQWRQISGPSITISNRNRSKATFVAPEVSDDSTIVVTLTVTDSQGLTDTDNVTIHVNDVNEIVCEANVDSRCYYSGPGATGDGSFKNPGSIESLIPQLSRGDYLYLRGGVYTDYYRVTSAESIINLEKYVNFSDPQPTVTQPVTIKGYPDEQVTIRGDLTKGCVHIDGISNLVLQDMRIENCFNKGVRVGYDIPEENITLRNIEFANMEYYDDSGFLYVHSYDNVVIENCQFHDYIPKAGTDQVGAYVKFYRATNITVRHNEFYGQGAGIYYKHGETTPGSGGYTRIHDNYFHDLTGSGNLSSIDTNQNRTEIYNNRFINTGGVRVHREDGTSPPFTTGVEISYNTFVGGTLYLADGSNDGSYMSAYGLGAKSANIHHNVFSDTQYRVWTYGSDVEFNEGINLSSDHNCYYSSTGEYKINYFAAEGSWGDLGDNYALSDWQALTYGANSIEGIPLLDEHGIQQSGSPCLGIGYSP
nr:hypothetical protein [Gilvimarinus sp. SDUM040013]